jgi:hypothetical protein
MNKLIFKDQPKEMAFKTLVQQFFKENPDTTQASISISRYKPSRSDAQNRLYWKWVDILGKELGYSKDETHLILADKFLGRIEITTKKGDVISTVKSTRGLKTGEFTDYLHDIDFFISEYDIVLPYGDDYKLAMGEKDARKVPQS